MKSQRTPLVSMLAALLALTGCSDGGSGAPDGSAPPADAMADVTATPDADVPDGSADGAVDGAADSGVGQRSLIAGDWTLPAGVEGYVCARVTLTETIYVHEFIPVIPVGTHHTVVTIDRSGEPDGVVPCGAGTNGPDMIYGSGLGTEPFALPDGVAVKIEAGEQVLLNLHLFNLGGASELSGTSGIDVVTIAEADVVHEAEVMLAGTEDISIGPRATRQEVGTCTLLGDTNVFAVLPHMHELGTFMNVEANVATTTTLLDTAYSFDEQRYFHVDPVVPVAMGETLTIRCDYDNPGDSAVSFGDSTRSEMCYAAVYHYPPVPGGLVCVR